MSIRRWPGAHADLARSPLVLSPGGARRGWIVWCALILAALLAGAAGSHLYWSERLGQVQQQAVARVDLQQLSQGLEQARLSLRVSDARSQELERQIDALNQQLHKCQEEVTFFRKARDGRP
jgi:uncharacterized protein HemX